MTDYINKCSDNKGLVEMLNNPEIQPAQIRHVIDNAITNCEYMGE